MFDHLGTALSRCFCIGQHRTGGVDVSFAVGPEPAEHTAGIHNWAFGTDFIWRHQVAIFDADGLVSPVS